MKIEDIGFIVFVRKYEENSLLVKLLTKNNGVITGYVNETKYNKKEYQIGNLLSFNWFAKNLTQLGTLRTELIKSYTSTFIENRFNLRIIENMAFLISNLLSENFLPDEELFTTMENIFKSMSKKRTQNLILKKYFYFENLLLNTLGTGIVLEDSNFKKLQYVSKNSGLAVSKEKGDPYKEKLLQFPTIAKTTKIKEGDFIECFEIIEFFLKKYLIKEIGNEDMYRKIIGIRDIFKKNIL
ncbi:MAG: DNA repair protein RecO [Rickettsiales bacterium]|nr:MAG: DNA repair protein RecO [Rickettsiales bacterium]